MLRRHVLSFVFKDNYSSFVLFRCCIFTQKVILVSMHVLPVGDLFVTAVFKAPDTARYLHNPICIYFLTLRPHIDVSRVVMTK